MGNYIFLLCDTVLTARTAFSTLMSWKQDSLGEQKLRANFSHTI